MAVFAVSYDPVETLERFASAHGITYPLLSDLGSVAITELGLLNATLEQERAAYGRPIEDRHRGIPYPGTFFLDERGVVTGKRFEQSHRIRPTATTLLRELTDDEGVPPAAVAEASSPGVRVAAWLDTDVVYANQLQELHVRVDLDDGVHLYTEPVPVGFRGLSVGVSGDPRIRAADFVLPTGSPFRVDGLEEEFTVIEDRLDITIPFIVLSNRDTAGDGARSVPITVDLGYQACTSAECFLPEAVALELELAEEGNPGYESTAPTALSPLAMRRIVEGPKREAELLELVNAALVGTEATAADLAAVLADLDGKGMIVCGPDGRWSEA